ncbi:dipeptide epimerase [Lactobacillus sp. LC28-10]|uniref:Dipeptide epimerase n=1 Tax=Secundilactobacillus angelensis TaxID=2722706 RepID=A0ABX1KYD5_9LACO|nr:dipeptide epimerase [Secundilactobacillus angelensis]MCH5463106.1 dipeptide epimerase [Secundilactobacillus angelensis]NLR18959.1 dipeptide epimerase [Secundilactobacillus angelensis]
MPLTIKKIETFPIAVPLKSPFKTALRTVTTASSLIVRLTDSDGVTGLGEAAPTAPITGDTSASIQYAVEQIIAPKLIGQSLNQPERIKKIIDTALVGNHSPKAAVNIAVNDLLAKHYGISLSEFLGGYQQTVSTDYTVSVGTATEMVSHAKQLVSEGFDTLKVKVGSQSPFEDLKQVRAIRSAVGTDIKIRLDANQGWHKKQAAKMINQMAEEGLEIELVEQPVPADDFEGMAYVTANTETPIMADESIFSVKDALRLLKLDGCDIINLKLMKAGGIDNALQINSIAEAFGVPCMVGSMIESQVSVTAAAEMAAAKANIQYYDLDAAMMFKTQPSTGGITHAGPVITIPDGIGLGVDFKAN